MNKRTFALGRLKSGLMNKTEARYSYKLKAMLLSGEILWYKFEGITLKLADDTRYTPDFAVMTKENVIELHEVKGSKYIFTDDAKVKVKVTAEQFPFVMKVFYQISKSDNWEMVEYLI